MKPRRVFWLCPVMLALFASSEFAPCGRAQSQSTAKEVEELKQMVFNLQRRVTALEQQNRQLQATSVASDTTGTDPNAAAELEAATYDLRTADPLLPHVVRASPHLVQSVSTTPVPAVSPLPGTLPGGVTLNYAFDGYYEFNFNQPTGRVNDLRAYDVLSNAFSINQADFIFDLDPDVTAHRRYGFRLDLQYGQATQTLQGNPANEPRPDIYRNIFQAYGSYIVPVAHGIDVDFGKWASSLGIEGNYTKDQLNYSRSYYFYFLPFYHLGVRTSYKVNDKLAINYWLVNGTNQSEPTNGYGDELFGYVLQPTKSVSWTFNYYNGQEHADTVPATNCTVPLQPGLCQAPLTPAPNGKINILDSYASWQAKPRLLFAGEGDYVIEREWANAAPGESSAPSHVDGGAAYVQYQLTPRGALDGRAEYMSDPQGLFSNASQALKEVTATYKFTLGDGFDTFLEYRRDWSNQPYFVKNNPAVLSTHQDTATLGLVWWYGGKQGAW